MISETEGGLPDEGEACEPVHQRGHLLAAQQEATEERGQQHRQAARQICNRRGGTRSACSASADDSA